MTGHQARYGVIVDEAVPGADRIEHDGPHTVVRWPGVARALASVAPCSHPPPVLVRRPTSGPPALASAACEPVAGRAAALRTTSLVLAAQTLPDQQPVPDEPLGEVLEAARIDQR
jgi:hypothetical protein